MIARKIPKRESQASNFAALVRYISNAHGKEERVGKMTITNDGAQSPADFGQAVVIKQLMNGRAKSDKTYHLLLSFPAGEQPSAEVLAQIEKRMCDALGYGDHQRISAVHHDTDDLHVHVAINKIHPTRFTYHNPEGDYRTMARVCLELEAEFGLIATNHESKKTTGQGRADDMERIAGLEPLRDYVRRTCPGLSQAGSWQAIHNELAAAGLTIKLQGAGLVILDGQGRGVKPSTVWRDLAKGQLEGRLGPFAAAAAGGPAVAQVYRPGPAVAPSRPTRVDTTALFARYNAEQTASKSDRAAKSSALTTNTRAQLASLKAQVKVQRKLIRLAPPGGPRAAMRAVHAATYRSAVVKILAANKEARAKLQTQARAMGWLEWLQDQALAGDKEALAALRARATAKPRPVAGLAAGQGASPMAPDSVTKTGVFIYRTSEATVRDDGERLHVSRGVQDKGVLAAIQIAKERHGGVLTVAGDASFQQRVVRLAALTDPTIRFTDPALERQRAAIAQQLEESQRDGRTGLRHGFGRGGPGADLSAGRRTSGGVHRARSGPAPRRADGTRADRSAAELARTAVRILRSGVAELGGGGDERPDSARRWPSLRDLSRSGLDDWRRGLGRVLPGPESDNLVDARQDADADRHLQRQGDGRHLAAGGPSPGQDQGRAQEPAGVQPLTAAEAYLSERNAKRAAGVDVPWHAAFSDGVQDLRLAGVRKVDGQSLVLLRAGDVVMVMPMDDLSASRVARMKVGDSIRVKNGVVQGRGRRL